MVSFQDDNIRWAYLKLTSLEYTSARREIIPRQFYLLATQNGIHLLVEEFGIDSPNTFKVVFAILVLRGIHTVYKIVIRT